MLLSTYNYFLSKVFIKHHGTLLYHCCKFKLMAQWCVTQHPLGQVSSISYSWGPPSPAHCSVILTVLCQSPLTQWNSLSDHFLVIPDLGLYPRIHSLPIDWHNLKLLDRRVGTPGINRKLWARSLNFSALPCGNKWLIFQKEVIPVIQNWSKDQRT